LGAVVAVAATGGVEPFTIEPFVDTGAAPAVVEPFADEGAAVLDILEVLFNVSIDCNIVTGIL
jgi:hypothetical protein